MEFNKEQIEKAKQCKTIEELKALAKNEGLNLSDTDAEKYFQATRVGELSDDELDQVAGGKCTQEEAFEYLRKTSKCPKCGAMGDQLHIVNEFIFDGKWMSLTMYCLKCKTEFESKSVRIKKVY